jgi:hypothetical protein
MHAVLTDLMDAVLTDLNEMRVIVRQLELPSDPDEPAAIFLAHTYKQWAADKARNEIRLFLFVKRLAFNTRLKWAHDVSS